MKNFTILLLTLSGLLLMACQSEAQSNKPAAATTAQSKSDQIEVLDFHNTHRCKACLSIEKATKEVLAQDFAKEMKSGRITFSLINAEDKANIGIVRKFGAFGSSLFLNVWSNGQDRAVDLTEFSFMTIDDESKFKKELREKIQAELKKI